MKILNYGIVEIRPKLCYSNIYMNKNFKLSDEIKIQKRKL